VGNSLFRTFAGGKAESIVADYLAGNINARECLSRECEALGPIQRESLEQFVDGFQLDPTFLSFAGFCAAGEIPLTILSDGLDFYVQRLLASAGLGHVPFYANRATWNDAGNGRVTLVPEFPYRDEHCDLCGNCKRNHLASLSADDDAVVYIGDGISDRCPVRYADFVFAKNHLIRYCQEQNVSFWEFKDFNDVRRRLEPIASRKRIRQRREAMMARRDLFIAE
jgi:2,3-diketo-5-methylthio-1-phosphopentane phosphatase